MVIKTRVKLSSGRTVNAFYLDEEESTAFLKMKSEINQLKFSLSRWIEKSTIFREILYEDLVDYYRCVLMKYIKENFPSQSFRLSDLRTDRSFDKERYTAFRRLEDEKFVRYRGGGWFRFIKTGRIK